MTLAYGAADVILNALLQNGTPYIMLHIGDPGDAGTANEAQVTDGEAADIARKACTFGAAANHSENTERVAKNTVAIEYSGAEIDASQEISYFSVWDAETGGNCKFIDNITTPKTTGSDGVTIAIGDLEVALSVYAKPA